MLTPPSVLKAALYFTGGGTTADFAKYVRIRSEEGSPTIITEATNGHVAIQIISNDQEFEEDELCLLASVKDIKQALRQDDFPVLVDDNIEFPDIDAAVDTARNQIAPPEQAKAVMQLQYFHAVSMALKTLFSSSGQERMTLTYPPELLVPIYFSAAGTTKDGHEVIVDMFVMGMRDD